MIRLPRAKNPRVGLGAAATVLGTISLLLFFLPVLGVPLGMLGLVIAVAGIAAALAGTGVSLRWSVAGLGFSALALGVNFAIAFAPSGYVHRRGVPSLWQGVNDVPRVSPPARPGAEFSATPAGHERPPSEARELNATAAPSR